MTGELDQQSWEKDGQKKSKMVLNVRNLTLLGAGKRSEPQEEFASF